MTFEFCDKFLLCAPEHYGIKYEINPWMSLKRGADQKKALLQWQTLEATFRKLGATLKYIAPDPAYPDFVFTANAGLVLGKKVVVSNFKFKERQGEKALFSKWFSNQGYEVLELGNGDFEGEGDALLVEDRLFGGYGFRSDQKIFPEVTNALGISKSVLCELVDSRFYHLDTCFCPLNSSQALFFPPAFSAEGRRKLEAEMELFAVPEVDAVQFVCNAVPIKKSIVIPAGSASTRVILEKLGFVVYEVELTEFIKAGGAAKCLCVRLQ